jgi:hypothetical protein
MFAAGLPPPPPCFTPAVPAASEEAAEVESRTRVDPRTMAAACASADSVAGFF